MVKVLDIPLYSFGFDAAVADIIQMAKSGEANNRLVSATGAHGIIEARLDSDFKTILSSFSINLPDGLPSVWVGKWKGAKKMSRCYGPSVFEAIIKQTSQDFIQHFFCGGKEGVADQLKAAVESWGNDNIVGTYCPPFREMKETEWQELGRKINESRVNMVWIGLSTPKQERFAWQLKNYVKVDFIITVGAAFDFHTGTVNQAPKWMQQIGLEWLFRLIMEPRRLYKRYLKIVPLFIWLNIKEFIDFYILKKY